MSQYNGHKNWNHWNISLWLNNDESLYSMAMDCLKKYGNRKDAAGAVWAIMRGRKTPDGANFSQAAVFHAMNGWEW
jgi:hypothetical protein